MSNILAKAKKNRLTYVFRLLRWIFMSLFWLVCRNLMGSSEFVLWWCESHIACMSLHVEWLYCVLNSTLLKYTLLYISLLSDPFSEKETKVSELWFLIAVWALLRNPAMLCTWACQLWRKHCSYFFQWQKKNIMKKKALHFAGLIWFLVSLKVFFFFFSFFFFPQDFCTDWQVVLFKHEKKMRKWYKNKRLCGM